MTCFRSLFHQLIIVTKLYLCSYIHNMMSKQVWYKPRISLHAHSECHGTESALDLSLSHSDLISPNGSMLLSTTGYSSTRIDSGTKLFALWLSGCCQQRKIRSFSRYRDIPTRFGPSLSILISPAGRLGLSQCHPRQR